MTRKPCSAPEGTSGTRKPSGKPPLSNLRQSNKKPVLAAKMTPCLAKKKLETPVKPLPDVRSHLAPPWSSPHPRKHKSTRILVLKKGNFCLTKLCVHPSLNSSPEVLQVGMFCLSPLELTSCMPAQAEWHSFPDPEQHHCLLFCEAKVKMIMILHQQKCVLP